MNKQKNYRRRQRGITPITTPRNSPGVAQFSMSEVAQFSVSLDTKLVPWKSSSWAWMYAAFWDALKVDRDNECIWIKKTWKRLQRHPYPRWQAILDDTKLIEGKEEEIKSLMQGI